MQVLAIQPSNCQYRARLARTAFGPRAWVVGQHNHVSATDLALGDKFAEAKRLCIEAKRLRMESQRLKSNCAALHVQNSHLVANLRGKVETPIDRELERMLARHFDDEEIRTLLHSALFQQVVKDTPHDIDRALLAGLEIMSWGRPAATRPPIRPTAIVNGRTTVV